MKKICLMLVAVAFAATVNGQVVLGLQGGYYGDKSVNSWNDDMHRSTTWLAGGQVGYQITPKLYFGVMGGYLSTSAEGLKTSVIADFDNTGMTHKFTNLDTLSARNGWTVQPVLRYEIFKYGNIHFHLMLQGTVRNMGYTTTTTSYNTYKNGQELIEADPLTDSVRNFSWSVSLRPTLTYEFSEHLSAELSLDFLSVGYIVDKEFHDADNPAHYHIVDGQKIQDVTTTSTMYAGLNTLMETLRWESPMLRFGFNYTF